MSGPQAIYVDIDDVLSHTIESLIDLLDRVHGRRVAVDEVAEFDLQESFDLDASEIVRFMDHAHADEVIESILPVEGGAAVLGDWRAAGYDVNLVTGRPPSTRDSSARWLERHGFPHSDLHFLDKYGRPGWNDSGLPALHPDELAQFGFVLAVEDSLSMAARLVNELGIEVALVDRPWNRDVSGVDGGVLRRITRCVGWGEIGDRFGLP